jgi:hypothetical protein
LAGVLVALVGVEFLQYLSVRTGELVRTRFADSAQLGIVKNHEFSVSFRHTDSFPQFGPLKNISEF